MPATVWPWSADGAERFAAALTKRSNVDDAVVKVASALVTLWAKASTLVTW